MEVISFWCSLTGRIFSCNEFVASPCLTPSRHTSYNAALEASWFKTAWTKQVRPETGPNNELFISFSTHKKSSSWIFQQLTTKPNRTLWPAPPSKQTSKKPHLGKPEGCFWWNLPDLHFGMAQTTFHVIRTSFSLGKHVRVGFPNPTLPYPRDMKPGEMLGNRVMAQNGWANSRKWMIGNQDVFQNPSVPLAQESTGNIILYQVIHWTNNCQKYVSTCEHQSTTHLWKYESPFGSFLIKWVFPYINGGTPISHPRMIIFR